MKPSAIVGLAGAAAIGAGVVVGIYLLKSDRFGGGEPTAQQGQFEIPVADGNMLKRGRKIYSKACASCHGRRLQGEPNWKQPKADGTLPAPPHDDSGHTWHHPDGFLFAYTKLGGQRFMPEGRKSGMPGFGNSLSDRQIVDVLAYIKANWSKDAQEKQARITEQATGG